MCVLGLVTGYFASQGMEIGREELKGDSFLESFCSSRYSSVIHPSFRGDFLLPHLFLILFKD